MHLDVTDSGVEASKDTLTIARRWLDEFGEVALATVVSTWGSSPVPVGGQLVVGADDQFEGSVSGGCVEVEVLTEAAEVLIEGTPKLLEFGVADEMAWRAGLPCGGVISIYLEALQRERDSSYLDRLLAARHARSTIAVLTNLATGDRRLIEAPGSVSDEIASALDLSESRIIELPDGLGFLHVIHPAIRLVVIGATQVGQILADLAKRVGYDVVLVDPRIGFGSKGRMGQHVVLTDWPETSLKNLQLDARTAVVTLSHVAAIDDEALRTALRSDALYVGALGSKKTHARRLERLRAAGSSESELTAIRAPVGLAIGAVGPGEIAVSILAEIVLTARQGK